MAFQKKIDNISGDGYKSDGDLGQTADKILEVKTIGLKR